MDTFSGAKLVSYRHCSSEASPWPIEGQYVSLPSTGGEYQAVVEYAPMQKTPYKSKVKIDARQGTIDDGEPCYVRKLGSSEAVSDPDYLSFLESLNTVPIKPVLEVSGLSPVPLHIAR